MMNDIELALEDCLNRLSSGEATLEECLARYPRHAVELRRLVVAAQRLERGRQVAPSALFKTRARTQLQAHMQAHPRGRRAYPWINLFGRQFGFVFSSTLRVALSVMVIGTFFFATGTVLAQQALPGQPLYGWKVTSEQVWRAVQTDPLAADLTLANRRMGELAQVAGNSQVEPLARQGYQQALATLARAVTTDSQEHISQTLLVQKQNLAEAGVTMPELEQLLAKINPQPVNLQLDYQVVATTAQQVTYALTVTNQDSPQPVAASSVISLSPLEKLVSVSEPGCTSTGEGVVTCPVVQLAQGTPYRVTLTTAVSACYSGPLSNTVTVAANEGFVNTNRQSSAVAAQTISPPYPRPAKVAYVQSSTQSHDLGLVTTEDELLNPSLHVRAAAPTWSPDGTKLAFFGEQGISELEGVYSQGNGLWVVDVMKNQARRPVQLVAQDHIANLTWSPDGAKLAFEVAPPGIAPEVVVVSAKNGQQLGRFSGQQPAWSPNSQQLVIRTCAPSCGLWQVDLKGRADKQITFDGSDSYPVWSSDGQYVAFSSFRDDDWEIYILNLADSELTRLTQRRATDTTPVFDRCGQALYLRTDFYGGWWLTVLKLDGSGERKVREGVGPSEDWGLARPAVY